SRDGRGADRMAAALRPPGRRARLRARRSDAAQRVASVRVRGGRLRDLARRADAEGGRVLGEAGRGAGREPPARGDRRGALAFPPAQARAVDPELRLALRGRRARLVERAGTLGVALEELDRPALAQELERELSGNRAETERLRS